MNEQRFENVAKIYCDGGVISKNPSSLGGTYAYRLLGLDDQVIFERATVITPDGMFTPVVTNNQTEMLALLFALDRVDDGFYGSIYSDSQVTLGRVFMGWKWTNMPHWVHLIYRYQRERMKNWEGIRYVLLDGHPTKAQLVTGFGKRGHPVSEHNVWCDHACGDVARSFLEANSKESV